MPEHACDYLIARFVPNPLRDEARNIGVVLRSRESGYVAAEFLSDLGKHLATEIDHDDVQILNGYVREIQKQLTPFRTNAGAIFRGEGPLAEDYFDRLWTSFNGRLQFTKPRVAVAADPEEELRKLFGILVEEETRFSQTGAAKRGKLLPNIVRELVHRRLKPRVGLQYPLTVNGRELKFSLGYKKVKGPRREVIIETVELTGPSFAQRLRALAPATVKFEIAKSHVKSVDAFCVVQMPAHEKGSMDSLSLETEAIKRHADRVFNFTVPQERDHFFRQVESDLRN